MKNKEKRTSFFSSISFSICKPVLSGLMAMLLIMGCFPCSSLSFRSVYAQETTESELIEEYQYQTLEDGSLSLISYEGTSSVVRIPEQVGDTYISNIAESCFAGNPFIEKVYVPEKVVSIGDYAFESCLSLKKIYFPESLISIGDGAFSGCSNLVLADIQDQVEQIGKGAFLFCGNLSAFTFPSSLKTLGDFAFAFCGSLSNVILTETQLEDIPDRAFYHCDHLSYVSLNKTIRTIGKHAFDYCSPLYDITFPASIEALGDYAFFGCNLTSVEFSGKTIGSYCFNSNLKLSYFDYTDNLEEIGAYAFASDDLTVEDLEFSESVKVDPTAFAPENPSSEYIPGEETEKEPLQADTTMAELLEKTAALGYPAIENDDFLAWAEKYQEANQNQYVASVFAGSYIMKYKGEIVPYYVAMSGAITREEGRANEAIKLFGPDYEEMFLMVDHGLVTEIDRFNNPDSVLLFSGIHQSQLDSASGTEESLSPEEMKNRIGCEFVDRVMISTTTDYNVAVGFGDVLFVIMASSESLNEQGAVCIDAINSVIGEYEILINQGAHYRIVDTGVLECEVNRFGEISIENKPYFLLELLPE